MSSSSLILPPLSVLYGTAIRVRLAAYSHGLLKSSRLEAPVVSIGNLTVGGTGKTPLVEKTCRMLAAEGRNVCVLTRGYRREQPQTRVLVSDGETMQASESVSGDEAFMLAENLLGLAAVVSDADRAAAGLWAMRELGSDVFVLDDGFQHLQLERDLNVLVVDASDPWGGGELLPTGRLREPMAGVSRADCVVITRADESPNLENLRVEIAKRASSLPVLVSQMQARGLRSLTDGAQVPLAPDPVAAFCGVGNPRAFFSLLRNLNYNVVTTRDFADHHRYTQQDIDKVVVEAKKTGAKYLVTTAKDAVKLKSLHFPIPCLVQDIELSFTDEEQFLALLRQSTESGRRSQ